MKDTPPTPEELGLKKFDYQLTITGIMYAEDKEQVQTLVRANVTVSVDLLSTNPTFQINTRLNSGLVIAHDAMTAMNSGERQH